MTVSETILPEGYKSIVNLYDTQKAIGLLKRLFEDKLCGVLNLRRVSAPLFVEASSGLNDDLNGIERAVSFDIPAIGRDAQVVHSLAKWKRMALYKYGFYPGYGLYTDMNAIRRDEDIDNIHSIYVDQWDWEKVITRDQRTEEYLKDTVCKIVDVIIGTHETICSIFPQITTSFDKNVTFVTTSQLEEMYPELTPKQRENEFVKEHHTTFLMQIGKKLKNGKPHDGRAPDYDDWSLNGDLLFWNDLLKCAFEISSMGIRVDENSLDSQLKEAGCDERRSFSFHKMLLAGELPLTIGGGIGQSRLCMLLMGKAHIGEVQASVWDDETKRKCSEAGIILL